MRTLIREMTRDDPSFRRVLSQARARHSTHKSRLPYAFFDDHLPEPPMATTCLRWAGAKILNQSRAQASRYPGREQRTCSWLQPPRGADFLRIVIHAHGRRRGIQLSVIYLLRTTVNAVWTVTMGCVAWMRWEVAGQGQVRFSCDLCL